MFSLLKEIIQKIKWKRHIRTEGPHQALLDAKTEEQLYMVLRTKEKYHWLEYQPGIYDRHSLGPAVGLNDIVFGNGKTALIVAVQNGQIEKVKLLIDAGADVNIRDNSEKTALMYAKTAEMTKLLLDAGATIGFPNVRGESALTIAVENNKIEQVKLLLDKIGKSAYLYVKEVLSLAKTAEMTKFLLDVLYSADSRARHMPVAPAAASAALMRVKTVEQIKLLLDAGADVNAADSTKTTPLMSVLILRRSPEVVKALIDAGADVNAANRIGKTALMIAAEHDRTEIVELLIAAGADINLEAINREKVFGYTLTDKMKKLLSKKNSEKQKKDLDFRAKLTEVKKRLKSKTRPKSVSGVVIADKIADMKRAGKTKGDITPVIGKKLRTQIIADSVKGRK